MSRKFSIAKTIDVNRLTRQIEIYEAQTGNENPYIFMNYDTIETIKNETLGGILNYPDTILSLKKSNGLIGYYQGYKVFKDDTLSFGEVELR